MRMEYASTVRRWHALALVLVVAVFLGYSLPPYFVGDSRVPPTFALHYPLLVAHILFGTVAMVCAVAQLWPGLRRRRPAVHRRVGRVYVVAAVPAAAAALVIGVATPFGPILAVSNVLLASMWLWFTGTGALAARRRDFAEHRRRMLVSATLALSTIANRIWTPILFVALHPLQDSVFGGSEQHFLWVVAGLGAWLGWSIPLAAVWWWLRRSAEMSSSSFSQPQHTSPV